MYIVEESEATGLFLNSAKSFTIVFLKSELRPTCKIMPGRRNRGGAGGGGSSPPISKYIVLFSYIDYY